MSAKITIVVDNCVPINSSKPFLGEHGLSMLLEIGGLRFLVDTGATSIALGPTDARRIGIDPNQGQKGLVGTANGNAVVSRVVLNTVRIGDITLHNVEAVVMPTEMPEALLGMSFLNRMEMQRDGNTMTLKKRF